MVAVLFASCGSDDASDAPDISSEPELVRKTLFCGYDEGTASASTRTCLRPADWATLWQEGDRLGVFTYVDAVSRQTPFVLTDGAGSTFGVFGGMTDRKASAFLAVYPYREEMTLGFDGNGLSRPRVNHVLFLPVQTAVDGSFDPASMVQVSRYSSGDTLKMYNLGAMLEVTSPCDCSSVTIATQDGQALTGAAVAGIQTAGSPAVTTESGMESYMVVLRGTIAAGDTYYVYTRPFTTGQRLKITYRDGDRAVTEYRGRTNGFTLERATIMSVPTSLTSASLTSAPSDLVDLGLSVLWSAKNIGADNETAAGDWFAWGETGARRSFGEGSYMYKSGTPFLKGKSDLTDGGATLAAAYDIASVLSAGVMRMPTKGDWDELLDADNCNWEWTVREGVSGYAVTSLRVGYEGRSIFLPVTDGGGNYWSATIGTTSGVAGYITDAYQMGFTSTARYTRPINRWEGCAIRPVANK